MASWVLALAAVALTKTVLSVAGLMLGEWPSPIRAGIFFLHVVAFAGAGLGLAMLGRGERRAGLLGLFLMLVATAFADPLSRGLETAIPSTESTVRLVRALEVSSFLAYVLWAFVSEFPRREYGRSTRIALAGARRLALGVGVFLLVANLARLGGVRGELPAALVRSFDRTGESTLHWPLLFLAALPALPWAFWSARGARKDERRRVRLLLTGIFLGVLPVVVITLLQAIMPSFLAYGLTPQGFLVIGLLVYPALLSIPITTAYAVLVQHALDVRLYVRQAVRYALARQTVGLTAALPFIVLLVVIYSQREQSVSALWSGGTGWLALASLGLGTGLVRSRTTLLNGLDRRFFREQYDAHQTLNRLVVEIRRFTSPSELAVALAHEIDRALHVRALHTLLLDPAAGAFVAPAGGVTPLGVDARLARTLEATSSPLAVDPSEQPNWLRALPSAERSWLAGVDARLLVPIHAADGSLLGLLLLAEKRSELPFTREDRMLLSTIAGSVAFAVERRVHFSRDVDASTGAGSPGADTLARECIGCGTVGAPGVRRCERCGDPTVPANLPVVLAGKFRLQQRIGAGGMGVVYRAVDLALDRDVAVKTLPNLSAAAARRLRREARAMAAVSHPNLALILGAETWRDLPFLIVEYLPGGTLADRLDHGPLPLEAALALGRALAPALGHLHDAGITHRDVKPSNIGFSTDGTPRLLDFGLARALDDADPERASVDGAHGVAGDAATTVAYLAGTPLYLSPEALAGERPGVEGDLWALSMVLYEAIAGRHPLADSSPGAALQGLARAALPDLHSVVPDVPPDVAEFFRSALAADRQRRPASARALAERLAQLDTMISAGRSEPATAGARQVARGGSS